MQGRQKTLQSVGDSLASGIFYAMMEMVETCVGGGSTWRHLDFILFLERELKSPGNVGKCGGISLCAAPFLLSVR